MEAIWNANPNINTLFCFEDGNCFVKHGDAASHAKTTGATYVIKVRNEEAFKKQVSKVIIDAVNDAQIIEEIQEETKPTKKSNK
jgi:hypothetical protein